MKYLEKSFTSSASSSDKWAENWERVFGKKYECTKCHKIVPIFCYTITDVCIECNLKDVDHINTHQRGSM